MKNDNTLSGEFPAVSTMDWEAKIKADLKGADYEKNLVWETPDKDRIRPYYRSEDLGGIDYLESLPGESPYLRTAKTEDNSWLIRQDIKVADFETANKEASEALSRGATSLGFDLAQIAISGEDDIHTLLQGIPLETVPVNFMSDNHYLEIMQWVHSYAEKNKIDPSGIRGSITHNPLGRLTATGNFRKDMLGDFSVTLEYLEYARENLPGFRVIHNSGNIIHDSGASITQELAFTLAMGNEYMVQLRAMNFPLKDILSHMQFQFSIGSSYFMAIAKLRAARFLWSRILEAYPASNGPRPSMFILSQTSKWNQTLYDPHVNMLRGTTEAMSAILGGTDSLTVHPYDLPLNNPNPQSTRIARNTQIILKEEAYLDKVIDPGAGSYYIENLTDTLITGAWELFLKTEEKGGYHKSLIEGFIQDTIKEMSGTRLARYASRRDMLLGTNQYPILDEKAGKLSTDPRPGGVPQKEEMQREMQVIDPLQPYRGAREFEELRMKTEMHPGDAPVVFIIPLGNLAMRRARAMFTTNFFSCAGFKVVDNIGKFTSVQQGMEEARKEGARIAVLCSSDDEYPAMGNDFSNAAGKDIIPVIAGYPKEHLEVLGDLGLTNFIHVRSNVLAELKNYQELLGIK